jgi:protein SCO1/2
VRLRTFVLLAALVPTLLFAQAGSQIAVSPGTVGQPVDKTKVKIDQNLGNQIPVDASFHDRTGKLVHFGELLDGKPAIILSIFYKCKGVCGLELQGTITAVKSMQKSRLGRDFSILVLSIHPKETPDLAEGKYESTVDEVAMPGTESGWKFLVGDWPNIHAVTDTVGFKYTYDEAKDAISHPSGIMFVTPTGIVSSYIYGAKYSPEAFERNLALAKAAKIGPKAEEVFFGCIHIDPLTGERSIVITNVIKLGGALTVIILTMTILVLSGKARIGFGKKA